MARDGVAAHSNPCRGGCPLASVSYLTRTRTRTSSGTSLLEGLRGVLGERHRVRLAATTGAPGRWRYSSMVVNVPVIMQRRLYSGSASDYLHRQSHGHPVVQQRMVLNYCGYGGDDVMAVGWGFGHFLRSSGCPGVERQFFEPSSTHTCECSRAPAN